MPEVTPTLTFRVPQSVARQLEEAGAARNPKLSGSQYARELVLAALSEPTSADLLAELHTLRTLLVRLLGVIEKSTAHDMRPELQDVGNDLHELKEGLATGVRMLLVKAGGLPSNEALDWVRQHMYPPRNES